MKEEKTVRSKKGLEVEGETSTVQVSGEGLFGIVSLVASDVMCTGEVGGAGGGEGARGDADGNVNSVD